jgi:hypothetical protein
MDSPPYLSACWSSPHHYQYFSYTALVDCQVEILELYCCYNHDIPSLPEPIFMNVVGSIKAYFVNISPQKYESCII